MKENLSNGGQGALFLFGGLALLVLGTGLVLAHPAVRQYLGKMGLSDIVQATAPDVEKYLKLRSM